MRKTLIAILMLFVCFILAVPAALADHYEYINFPFKGNTYTIRYSVEGKHFERVNTPAESFKGNSFEYTAEYAAYIDAEDAAKKNFLRSYANGELGDDSIPLWMLCAESACLAFVTLFVHGKRRSFCSVKW